MCALTALALVIGLVAPAVPARADTVPPAGEPATVSADPLPTVQINGVVWSQVVVGNTVYAAGNFTSARPAGNAPGVGEVPRTHLLAYDIRTGVMDPGFAPVLDGQVLAITKSPDNSRIYIGGEFTRVNGAVRSRLAAISTATGAVVSGFDPLVGSTVRAVTASSTAVYFGGDFSSVDSVGRTYAAAVSAATGELTAWNPAPDASVMAMTLNPSQSLVVIGGRFQRLGGSAAYGLGAVDPSSGSQRPWAINQVIRNAGAQTGITSLSADDVSVYGTGYTFGSGGNFEGTFRANGDSGAVEWIADCLGDHYSVFSQPGSDVVYDSSHTHNCSNIQGGFLETNPWMYLHSNALTKQATGTVVQNPVYVRNYVGNFNGRPAPTMLHWYPVWSVGSFTGQQQAGWHVTGNSDYVVYGGEFRQINGTAQQGLVRFGKTNVATNRSSPQSAAGITPTAVSVKSGEVALGWQATFDRDNRDLTYRVYRNFTALTNPPIHTVTVKSQPWDRPTISFTDTGLTPGSTQRYRVYVFDPFGNAITGSETSVVVAGPGQESRYAQAVLASDPEHWYRLDESSGTVLTDSAGSSHLIGPASFTRGVAGASGDKNTATTFAGTNTSYAADQVAQPVPGEFSVEAWVKTNTSNGGRIIGFSDTRTGTSRTGWTDRHLYMANNGRIIFGVNPGTRATIQSTATYRDNQWHHVVGTLGSNGMRLYVDGSLVASNASTTSARQQTGYWRIGGDSLSGWTSRPSSDSFNGTIDEAAVYNRVLSPAEVSAHYQATAAVGPTASFTAATDGLAVALDGRGSYDLDGSISSWSWNLGDGSPTRTGSTLTHTYAASGTYQVRLTVTDNAGKTATTTQSVFVTSANTPPTASFTSSAAGLQATFDAHGSSDADGTIASYSWNYGDGSPAGSGVAPTHTYAGAGTYTVTLTVTDNRGASATTTRAVTVTGGPVEAAFAADTFARSSATGWGNADTGGAWTVSGSSANYSVASGVGNARIASAGGSVAAYLNAVNQRDQDVTLTFSLDKLADGGGTYVNVAARGTSSNAYRGKVWVKSNGTVQLQLMRVLSGAESALAAANIAGLTVEAGTRVNVRVQSMGSAPTTVRIKAWLEGAAEPTAWNLSATDSTAALQSASGLGMMSFVSGSATNAPITVSVDNLRATAAATEANSAPSASFTSSVAGSRVTFDGRASSDPDGSIAAYSWDYGDGSEAGAGATPSHDYAGPGTYTVVLTVTDDRGATGTTSRTVTVGAANQPPTAAFTTTVSGMGVSVNAGGSQDPDGPIASYTWDFGDGTAAGSGVTASHTYAAPGTYTVRLTVADGQGATGTTTRSVTVGEVQGPIAADPFARTVSGAWGSADTGGNWTVAGTAANYGVANGVGTARLDGPGRSVGAHLNGVAAVDQDLSFKFSLDKVTDGGGTYLFGVVRGSSSNAYLGKVWVKANGTVQVQAARVVSNAETILAAVNLSGLTVAPGTVVNVRVQAVGTGTTTVRVKAWADGTAEPAAWGVSATDATPQLQAAGGLGVKAFMSGSATNAPVTISVDDLLAIRP